MTDEELEILVHRARGSGAGVITYDETLELCRSVRLSTARACAEECEKWESARAGASAIRARFGVK